MLIAGCLLHVRVRIKPYHLVPTVRTIHIKSAKLTVHHAIGIRIADLRTFFLQNWSKHIQSIAENAWLASEIIAAQTLRTCRSLFYDSNGIDGGR